MHSDPTRGRAGSARPRAPFFIVLALLAASWSLPAAAQPVESLGVTPVRVTVKDAIQGETYAARVLVQNMFPSAATLELRPEGALGEWTTTVGGPSLAVPARTERFLDLRIAVPPDAPGGPRSGLLRITAAAGEGDGGTGAVLRTSVAVLLDMTVGGEPLRRVVIRDVAPEDVEEGSLPRLDIRLANEGNIEADEEVVVRIRDEEGKLVREIRTSVRLLSGQDATSTLTLDEALPAGRYRVSVRGSETEDFIDAGAFEVVAPGTLGLKGKIITLAHATTATAGRPLKVVAVFANAGTATIAGARFEGELTRGGEIVELVDSDTDLVLKAGERVNITFLVTPRDAGEHVISGRVVFERSQTAEATSRFDALAASVQRASGFGLDLGGLLFALGSLLSVAYRYVAATAGVAIAAGEAVAETSVEALFWPWWIPPTAGIAVYLLASRRPLPRA